MGFAKVRNKMNRFTFLGKIYYKTLYKINRVKCIRDMGVNVGNNLHIYGNVNFGTEPWLITLGDNVHITDGVKFICHDGGTLLFRDRVPDLEITAPIRLGNCVYVGNNVIFLPGVTIGDNVIIGAGAVVSKSIPSNSVVAGVPARVIKSADEYFEKIQKNSLHLGHLSGKEKDDALKKYFSYNNNIDV